jgi:hypothetical protein
MALVFVLAAVTLQGAQIVEPADNEHEEATDCDDAVEDYLSDVKACLMAATNLTDAQKCWDQ